MLQKLVIPQFIQHQRRRVAFQRATPLRGDILPLPVAWLCLLVDGFAPLLAKFHEMLSCPVRWAPNITVQYKDCTALHDLWMQ
jgi:hypothetical protein